MSDRVSELRQAFDQAFAVPARTSTEEFESLLAIRVHGDPFAVSTREIAGLESSGVIVPLPSRSPGILGITGLRGGLIPVHSLAVLLGYGAEPDAPRWLALVRTPDLLALSVGEFEGHLRVPRACLHEPQGTPRRHVVRLAQVGQTVRSIVSIASVAGAIRGGSER